MVCDADIFRSVRMVGGLFYFNYPGGTGLMAGSVFGRISGNSAGLQSQ
jgi:tricarballylate dehydrogenase